MAIAITYHSTLDGFIPEPGRQKGNTTRIIDHAVQQIFIHGAIVVHDHFLLGRDASVNGKLFTKIVNRLRVEHPDTRFVCDIHAHTIHLTHMEITNLKF